MKKQTGITKDQYKFFKDQKINNREDDVKTEDGDNRGEDISGESNITKEFDAILDNNGTTTKSISVKSRGNNINLHLLIIKLLNTEEMVLKKDYGFDEVFNIFNGIDNKHNKLNEYNSRTPNKTDAKNVMLQYLKSMEDRLIDLFSTFSITRKINNTNYKEYF